MVMSGMDETVLACWIDVCEMAIGVSDDVPGVHAESVAPEGGRVSWLALTGYRTGWLE